MDVLTILLLIINSIFIPEAPLTETAMQEFATKLEPYYALEGLPTDTGNTSLHEIPNLYWGATVWKDRCTNQVYLSQSFTSPDHPFYNTPMWKYVLAHEWAHVAQGINCWENEVEAQLIALEILAEAEEWDAVFTALKWMLTLSASQPVIDQLNLTEKEARYYRAVNFTQLEVVELLVNDEDGNFELRSGIFIADRLWLYLNVLPDGFGERDIPGAR